MQCDDCFIPASGSGKRRNLICRNLVFRIYMTTPVDSPIIPYLIPTFGRGTEAFCSSLGMRDILYPIHISRLHASHSLTVYRKHATRDVLCNCILSELDSTLSTITTRHWLVRSLIRITGRFESIALLNAI